MHFGFSYVGLIFLTLLMVPNLIWTKNQPKDYEKYAVNENKILLAFERVGEVLASCLVLIFSDFTGIDLSEIDPKDGKLKYYCFRYAKNGCFKLRFGEWGELNHPYNDIGTVVVDMLTKEAEMISPDNGDQ